MSEDTDETRLLQQVEEIADRRNEVEQNIRELDARERSHLGPRRGRGRGRGVFSMRGRGVDRLSASASRGPGPFGRAAPLLRSQRPQQEGDTLKRYRYQGEEDTRDGAPPAAKRIGSIVSVPADSAAFRKDAEEDEPMPETPIEEESQIPQPKIISTIVPPRPPVTADTPGARQRNRRMFGHLLGTLQRIAESGVSETERRRAEIEAQVELKVKNQQQELLQNALNEIRGKREQEFKLVVELREKEEAARLKLIELKWERHKKLLIRYHKTVTTPSIYYLPKFPLDVPGAAKEQDSINVSPAAEIEKQSDEQPVQHEDDDRGEDSVPVDNENTAVVCDDDQSMPTD